ncbi:hypothetical protein HNP52_003949 [Sphingomonas kyeonggiensis]|uniref:DUF1440 domain-containing protein n=1 Tax=Sphingomonas kyeonggiensis TaxID=1268553 RepID=A0A7W7K530_9SPHN|nr:hypothetical protein [Sphingomonas kyeonggiensis]MBB4840852.1 hypothetical protein [Sphingomonas kyeonggiensis]
MARAGQRILVATLVAGALDIAAAVLLAIQAGRTPDKMLRGVASGPFPEAVHWGLGGAALGLAVHFAIMAVMAAVYILAADRLPALKAQRLLAGILYGIATWAAMNLVVLPLRWPAVFPHLDPQSVATQLFCHIVLVGLPIALIAARR